MQLQHLKGDGVKGLVMGLSRGTPSQERELHLEQPCQLSWLILVQPNGPTLAFPRNLNPTALNFHSYQCHNWKQPKLVILLYRFTYFIEIVI